MVTREGFNALLKTLEEPPAHAKFIFATTAIDKFPDTIVSRCQRYDFRRIPAARIGEQLRAIAAEEGVTITDGAVYVIAREAEGSLRDAESLLDRMIAFSGTTIDDEEVSRVLGVADRHTRNAVAEAVLGADARRALEVVADIHESGRDLERFSRDLLEHFRNLTVVKLYGTRGTLRDLPDEEIDELRRQSETRAFADLQRMFRIALQADDELRRSTVPRMVLEMTVVRLATLEPAAPVDEVLRRLDELEQSLLAAPSSVRPRVVRSGGGETSRRESPRAPEPVASAPAAEAPTIEWEGPSEAEPPSTRRSESVAVPSPVAAPAPIDSPVDAGRWEEFLEFVRRKRVSTYFTLSHARVLEHASGSLRLAVGRESWAKELRSIVPALAEYAAEFFGEPTQVGIEMVEPTAAVRPRNPIAEALENPAVQKAVDAFGGQVREVRELTRRPRGE
ncbi:MAG: polymerase subunit gamma/tau, partial [Candidatus Binatota bacterium]|nr:polymerase subunit gamma/tau [Candidatus Binatota bacterium]